MQLPRHAHNHVAGMCNCTAVGLASLVAAAYAPLRRVHKVHQVDVRPQVRCSLDTGMVEWSRDLCCAASSRTHSAACSARVTSFFVELLLFVCYALFSLNCFSLTHTFQALPARRIIWLPRHTHQHIAGMPSYMLEGLPSPTTAGCVPLRPVHHVHEWDFCPQVRHGQDTAVKGLSRCKCCVHRTGTHIALCPVCLTPLCVKLWLFVCCVVFCLS
jgi:hypothetical protein